MAKQALKSSGYIDGNGKPAPPLPQGQPLNASRIFAWLWPPPIRDLPALASGDEETARSSAHALNRALCDTFGNVLSGQYQFAVSHAAESVIRPEGRAAALTALGRMKPHEERRVVRRYIRLGGQIAPSPEGRGEIGPTHAEGE